MSGSGLNPDASSSQYSNAPATNWAQNGPIHSEQLSLLFISVVMAGMKSLAAIGIATGVMRAELVRMQQERDESFRTFAARVHGNAETCAYITKVCLREVDFTDSIIGDVQEAGIADLDIRRDVLGTSAILERAVNDVISLVECKEMARNALPSSASGTSSFKRGRPVCDRYQQHNRLPMVDPTLRCAQIVNKHVHSSRRKLAVGAPNHTTNA